MASDIRALADSLHHRPTRLAELVLSAPSYIGASDASGIGMGGVWFSVDDPDFPLTLWRQQRFEPSIPAALVSSDNRTGSISISDLEIAAMIGHKDVLTAHAHVTEHTVWMVTDNATALS